MWVWWEMSEDSSSVHVLPHTHLTAKRHVLCSAAPTGKCFCHYGRGNQSNDITLLPLHPRLGVSLCAVLCGGSPQPFPSALGQHRAECWNPRWAIIQGRGR